MQVKFNPNKKINLTKETMPRLGPKIFVLQPFAKEFLHVYEFLIKPAAERNAATIYRFDEISTPNRIIEGIYEAIENADLIICDITNSNPNVMYELGFAHASRKPVILLTAASEHTPFDITTTRMLFYNPDPLKVSEQVKDLYTLIRDALTDPDSFSARPSTDPSINTIFISYSHKDVDYLHKLFVHLRPLEKSGIVDPWADTKLEAGDNWKEEIERALSKARAAILLVSADFLASDFIVDNELPPLLANAETRGARIIPVIIKPCRFARDKNLKRFQAVNDPSKPLANMPDADQEVIYDKVSELVERTVDKNG